MKHTEYIVPIGDEAENYDEMFIGVIRTHPALVRCKDCIWRRTFYHGDGRFSYTCAMLYLFNGLDDNDYCSKAVRKEHADQ